MQINPKTERIQNCIICNNSQVIEDKLFSTKLALTDQYGVLQCLNCELRWLSPRPSKAAYEELYKYENYFFEHSDDKAYVDIVADRISHYIGRIKKIESLMGINSKLRILDIGAATGEFVNEAINAGHITTGIEPSSGARQVAKKNYNIELVNADIEDVDDEKFDVVHMNHVLEHLYNPAASLKKIHKVLNENGRLIIEVPQQFENNLDRLRSLLNFNKQKHFGIYSLHHTYFFKPGNLSALIEKNGFSIEYIATANPNRTPLYPPKVSNYILRLFLGFSDLLNKGGNIIEVYAKKRSDNK